MCYVVVLIVIANKIESSVIGNSDIILNYFFSRHTGNNDLDFYRKVH